MRNRRRNDALLSSGGQRCMNQSFFQHWMLQHQKQQEQGDATRWDQKWGCTILGSFSDTASLGVRSAFFVSSHVGTAAAIHVCLLDGSFHLIMKSSGRLLVCRRENPIFSFYRVFLSIRRTRLVLGYRMASMLCFCLAYCSTQLVIHGPSSTTRTGGPYYKLIRSATSRYDCDY